MTRHPASDLIEGPHPSAVPVDEALGGDPSIALERTLIAVHVHEVEKGDIIAGLRTPVDSILTSGDGNWWYGSGGTFIAIRSSWGTVDVWREIAEGGGGIGLLDPEACSADSNDNNLTRPTPSAANPDWANPHGIRRPLRAVPS